MEVKFKTNMIEAMILGARQICFVLVQAESILSVFMYSFSLLCKYILIKDNMYGGLPITYLTTYSLWAAMLELSLLLN